MSFLTNHPFKALYVLLAVLFETFRFPYYIFTYIFPSGRPNPKWTFRQAIGVRVVRQFLAHSGAVEAHVPLPLTPGAEKAQFVLLSPAASKYYTGPLAIDPATKPERIGGTWYPRKPTAADLADAPSVALHFHGGAYVIGDGRSKDAGFAAATLQKSARIPFIFCPQYRLSGGPTFARFPAAIQDGVSSYLYLQTEFGVPAGKIVLSGDSAGGNLVLSLLRYVEEFGAQIDLQRPLAALLWSPWCEPHMSADEARTRSAPNYSTDYIPSSFGAWGSRRYIPASLSSPSAKYADYISHLNQPLTTKTPVWVTTGSSEVLFNDIMQLVEELKKAGTEVQLDVQENAVHDFILVGHMVGFQVAARRAAGSAGEFVKAALKKGGSGKL